MLNVGASVVVGLNQSFTSFPSLSLFLLVLVLHATVKTIMYFYYANNRNGTCPIEKNIEGIVGDEGNIENVMF